MRIPATLAFALMLAACTDPGREPLAFDLPDAGGAADASDAAEVDPTDHPYRSDRLDLHDAPDGKPCRTVATYALKPDDPTVTRLAYDAQGRLRVADELFDDGSRNDRVVYVYTDAAGVYPTELVHLDAGDLVWRRTVWTYEAGRLSGGHVETSGFEQGVGLETRRLAVTYNGDAWRRTEDEGVDLGSAGDGTLQFDGEPDRILAYSWDPATQVLRVEQDEGGNGQVDVTATMTLGAALGSPNDVMTFPSYDLSGHVLRLEVDSASEQTPDETTEFEYDDEDRLVRMTTTGTDPLVDRTLDHVYVCPE